MLSNEMIENLVNCPFPKDAELNSDLEGKDASKTVPGFPNYKLADDKTLQQLLTSELWAQDLEKMAPHLWWMSRPGGDSVSALHRQIVKGRKVIITEEPRLHLVWIDQKIFIKPLPKYLLSYKFWTKYLKVAENPQPLSEERKQLSAAALGFIRTYSFLIQHESDLTIAKKNHLIGDEVTWPRFCAFAAYFKDIKDRDVSLRYNYGEIRLTRLNIYVKILLRKRHYQRIYIQYGQYFTRFFGPILFSFAVLSLILSSMSLILAVDAGDHVAQPVRPWHGFRETCRWFGVLTLTIPFTLSLFFVSALLYKIGQEWRYAIKAHKSAEKERGLFEEKSVASMNEHSSAV